MLIYIILIGVPRVSLDVFVVTGVESGTVGGVEWERPNRAKRHCPFHLAPQALQIKCPSVGVRTTNTPVDSEGTARGRV